MITQEALAGQSSAPFQITAPQHPRVPAVVSTGSTAEDAMINRLFRQGKAAGLANVLYDNRDQDHSRLDLTTLPQLRETRYQDGPIRQRYGTGLAGPFRFDLPVIGNASLAVTRGIFSRSLPRLAMQSQVPAQTAYGLYAANHLYVHPEHRDHDLAIGDLYAAQTPYMLISQGSSGSDRAFLRALALTYAAFPPNTFARLREEGLLPATAQMILRRTRQEVRSDAQYLSPAAHPTAFAGESLRPLAMISLANSLRPDQIPPMVTLRMVEDLRARRGWDYLAVNLSEELFTTPSAIARIWRSFAGQRRMVISAASSKDPNGHPLQFHWVLLRGNPEKVTITTNGPGDAQAEILVDWHDPSELRGPSGIASSRVEIAVIAHNGFHYSAPAFISLALPLYQKREYAGAGAESRLWRINYRADQRIDPLIWPIAPWDDRLAHGPDGQINAMTRRRQNMAQPDTLRRKNDGSWEMLGAPGTRDIARLVHRAAGPPGQKLQLQEAALD
ncbi:MAG: hypothetical protein OIF40_16025 [Mangrovicoccus sp.]|nr:hypothetical protein [Mangrovicoccus sp.]